MSIAATASATGSGSPSIVEHPRHRRAAVDALPRSGSRRTPTRVAVVRRAADRRRRRRTPWRTRSAIGPLSPVAGLRWRRCRSAVAGRLGSIGPAGAAVAARTIRTVDGAVSRVVLRAGTIDLEVGVGERRHRSRHPGRGRGRWSRSWSASVVGRVVVVVAVAGAAGVGVEEGGEGGVVDDDVDQRSRWLRVGVGSMRRRWPSRRSRRRVVGASSRRSNAGTALSPCSATHAAQSASNSALRELVDHGADLGALGGAAVQAQVEVTGLVVDSP